MRGDSDGGQDREKEKTKWKGEQRRWGREWTGQKRTEEQKEVRARGRERERGQQASVMEEEAKSNR